MRKAWEFAYKGKSLAFVSFSSVDELLSHPKCGEIKRVFIDFDLGLEKNGIELAEILREKGFDTIYLASGNTSVAVPQWMAGSVGKRPPV